MKEWFRLLFVMVLLPALYSSSTLLAQSTKEYLITNYGAARDGKTLNTATIRKAIDVAAKNGGGKVVVPKGIFLTGTLELKSNIELHVEENATLLGSANDCAVYSKHGDEWKAIFFSVVRLEHIE